MALGLRRHNQGRSERKEATHPGWKSQVGRQVKIQERVMHPEKLRQEVSTVYWREEGNGYVLKEVYWDGFLEDNTGKFGLNS